jgi:predicted amino acid dehydrogenase
LKSPEFTPVSDAGATESRADASQGFAGEAHPNGFRILEIYFPADVAEARYSFDYLGTPVEVEVAAGRRDVGNVENLISAARGQFDAVALSGFSLTYTVGDKYYRHKQLRGLLSEEENTPLYVCDGIRSKDTVDRHLTRLIVESLQGDISNRRTLVLSGIDRWGVSEVLSAASAQTIYGDLMYNLRLGIPLFSLGQVRAFSPLILGIVTRAPLDWYFPGARRRPKLLPRWRQVFYWSEVIVGGMTYLKRYAPQSLDGKVVVTNLRSDDEVEWLRSRGTSTVASLTPVLSGKRVSASVMEAVMTLATRGKVGHRRDRYLDEIIRLMPVPEIISFEPPVAPMPVHDERALESASPLPFAQDVPPAVFSASPETAKFCFVIHPLTPGQLARHPVLRRFRGVMTEGMMEAIAAKTPSFVASRTGTIISETGALAEGWILVLPITPRLMLRMPPEQVYERLVELAGIGQELGASVMGLGAFTSVVGDAGVSVARRSPIAITTGNSYTVAATLETISQASARIGIELPRSTAMVVGATGSIGSVLARLLADKVREIVLVSPRPERLIALGALISREAPEIVLSTTTNVKDHIKRADIVVTTTSAIDPIVGVEHLKPGALVCDVARPPDIAEESARARPDVLVIESGEIALPSPTDLGFDIGLPPNTIYACLAETILLALEGITTHFTLGRTIHKSKVELTAEMGKKHGFKLAGLRSFGQLIDEERIDLVRKARRRAYG